MAITSVAPVQITQNKNMLPTPQGIQPSQSSAPPAAQPPPWYTNLTPPRMAGYGGTSPVLMRQGSGTTVTRTPGMLQSMTQRFSQPTPIQRALASEVQARSNQPTSNQVTRPSTAIAINNGGTLPATAEEAASRLRAVFSPQTSQPTTSSRPFAPIGTTVVRPSAPLTNSQSLISRMAR